LQALELARLTIDLFLERPARLLVHDAAAGLQLLLAPCSALVLSAISACFLSERLHLGVGRLAFDGQLSLLQVHICDLRALRGGAGGGGAAGCAGAGGTGLGGAAGWTGLA
jgi:hypothetical protein